MRRLAITLVLLCALGATTPAFAASIPLKPGIGVGEARLGSRDSSAVNSLKRMLALRGSGVDNNYAGQRVYYYRFGARLKNGHYPLEMYAKRSHIVFMFDVYSSIFVTSSGIRVGSTESALRSSIGLDRKPRSTPTYLIYSTGGRTNHTDYYVSKSTLKVYRVLISRY